MISAGLTWFAYTLVTDSDMAARLIKAQAALFLPRSIVEMGRVSVGIVRGGQVEVRQDSSRQRIDGQLFETASIAWLSVRLDSRQLFHGQFEPREVIVSQPTLRLCRGRDGTWNLQGLIAEPWPGPVIKNPPPIVIRNGTVELIGIDEPRRDRPSGRQRDPDRRYEEAGSGPSWSSGRRKADGTARSGGMR